ncbi:hypothetical protein ACLOJK_013608, partial [Asimina triloba]
FRSYMIEQRKLFWATHFDLLSRSRPETRRRKPIDNWQMFDLPWQTILGVGTRRH